MRNGIARKAGLLLASLAAAVVAMPANAASVSPVKISGNPDCDDYGLYGFKLDDDPPAGPATYTFTDSSQHGIDTDLESGTPSSSSSTVTVTDLGGSKITWSANRPIARVIMKGGSYANVYTYSPSSMGDSELVTPNNSSGSPAGISHVSFCFKPVLTVTKTATTSFTRTWNWSIEKSVKPASWSLFEGDSATSSYTIAVDRKAVDSGWAVSGSITVANSTGKTATVSGVSDSISGFGAITVSCPTVSFPKSLSNGQSFVCTYTSALPDGASRTNTATASVSTSSNVEGASGTAAVQFGEPTTVVDASVKVVDDMATDATDDDKTWNVDGPTTLSYDRTFDCEDEGTHVNTATLVLAGGNGGSDDATVDVACHGLTVTKDANTSLERSWKWTIDKSANAEEIQLDMWQWWLDGGEGSLPSKAVAYTVELDATKQDSGFAVAGTITVANDNPARAAVITSVSDLISPDIAVDVDCDDELPITIPAGESIECSYQTTLADAETRTNTATATLQNYAYPAEGEPSPSGTSEYTGTAAVDFANATIKETDEQVSVDDTRQGSLGNVLASETPKTIGYERTLGADLLEGQLPKLCGPVDYPNTASFLTNDSGATGSDSWTVTIRPLCDPKWIGGGDEQGKGEQPNATPADTSGSQGQTGGQQTQQGQNVAAPLTPTPAPIVVDPVLPGVGNTPAACVSLGELGRDAKAPFYRSGTTWEGILAKRSPRAAYFKLARATLVARLAIRGGAKPGPKAASSLRWAVRYLRTYGPANTAAQRGLGANGDVRITRVMMRHHAAVLRAFVGQAVCK